MRQTFEQYMAAVDTAVYKKAGLSVHDLADQPFYEFYTDGITPKQAATLVLAEEGFPG